MADTDALKPYKYADAPALGGDKLYLAQQLQQISQSVALIIQVMKKLEARMTAHGI